MGISRWVLDSPNTLTNCEQTVALLVMWDTFAEWLLNLVSSNPADARAINAVGANSKHIADKNGHAIFKVYLAINDFEL